MKKVLQWCLLVVLLVVFTGGMPGAQKAFAATPSKPVEKPVENTEDSGDLGVVIQASWLLATQFSKAAATRAPHQVFPITQSAEDFITGLWVTIGSLGPKDRAVVMEQLFGSSYIAARAMGIDEPFSDRTGIYNALGRVTAKYFALARQKGEFSSDSITEYYSELQKKHPGYFSKYSRMYRTLVEKTLSTLAGGS